MRRPATSFRIIALQILFGLLLIALTVKDVSRGLGNTTVDPLVFARLGATGLSLAAVILRPMPLLRALRHPVGISWLLLFLWLLVGGVYSEYPLLTTTGASLVLASFLVTIAVAVEVPTESFVFSALMALAILLAAGLVAYFVAPDIGRMSEWDPEAGVRDLSGRMRGIAGAANIVGRMAGLYLILTFSYRSTFPDKRKGLIYGGAALALLCIFLSGSRTALFAAALAGIITFIMSRNARWTIPLLVATVAIGVLGLMPAAEFVSQHLSRHSTGDILTGRTIVWGYAFDIIRSHWLLGVGYNTTVIYFPKMAEALGRYFLPAHAHNFYLQMWVSGGIIAFVLGIVSVLMTFGAIIVQKRRRVTALYLFWFFSTFTETGGFNAVPTAVTFCLFIPVALLLIPRAPAAVGKPRGARAPARAVIAAQ